jgi:hypothetical protein
MTVGRPGLGYIKVMQEWGIPLRGKPSTENKPVLLRDLYVRVLDHLADVTGRHLGLPSPGIQSEDIFRKLDGTDINGFII